MKAYHIYLFRHGATQGNAEGRYIGGRTDEDLSGRGEAQLRRLAAECRYPQADVFFTSPLMRCRRSLEILYPQAAPQVVPGLAECNFGIFENKTMEELKDSADYQKWASCKGKEAPPLGESAQTFQKRCARAFEEIVDFLLRKGTTRSVVMAHGGVIMMILGTFAYPRRHFYDWMAENGTGFEVVITPQLWMGGKAMEAVARVPEGASENGIGKLQDVIDDIKRTTDEG